MKGVRIEPLREEDLPTVLRLNNDAVPATSELTLAELTRLWSMASYALDVRVNDTAFELFDRSTQHVLGQSSRALPGELRNRESEPAKDSGCSSPGSP